MARAESASACATLSALCVRRPVSSAARGTHAARQRASRVGTADDDTTTNAGALGGRRSDPGASARLSRSARESERLQCAPQSAAPAVRQRKSGGALAPRRRAAYLGVLPLVWSSRRCARGVRRAQRHAVGTTAVRSNLPHARVSVGRSLVGVAACAPRG